MYSITMSLEFKTYIYPQPYNLCMYCILQKKLSNKKGISDQALLVIIISVTIFIILLFLSNSISDILKKKGAEESFRTAVITAVKAPKDFVTLPMERRQVVLLKEGYTLDGKEFDVPGMDKDAISKIIAEEMRSCWYKFLEGQQSVFSHGILNKDNICYICSTISVKADGLSERNLTLPNFDQYLRDHRLLGTTISYWDYFNVHSYYVPWSWSKSKVKHEILPKIGDGSLDLAQPHAIIILSSYLWRDLSEDPFLPSITEAIALGGILARNENFGLFIMLRNLNQSETIDCSMFYN